MAQCGSVPVFRSLLVTNCIVKAYGVPAVPIIQSYSTNSRRGKDLRLHPIWADVIITPAPAKCALMGMVDSTKGIADLVRGKVGRITSATAPPRFLTFAGLERPDLVRSLVDRLIEGVKEFFLAGVVAP